MSRSRWAVCADSFDDSELGSFDGVDGEAFAFEVVERIAGDV
jgi:hypothetical protein